MAAPRASSTADLKAAPKASWKAAPRASSTADLKAAPKASLMAVQMAVQMVD